MSNILNNFKPNRIGYRKNFQHLTSPDIDGAEYLYGRQVRRLEPLNLQQCYPQKTSSTTTVKQTTTLRTKTSLKHKKLTSKPTKNLKPKTTLKPKKKLTSKIKINQNKYLNPKS